MNDLMDKIEVQKLMKILDERDIMFTIEDIRELMNSELEKPPSEMDTELIDLCVAVIGRQYSTKGNVNPSLSPVAEAEFEAMFANFEADSQSGSELEQESESNTATSEPISPLTDAPKKRKVKFSKVLLIAAIIVLISALAVPVGASLLPSKTTDKIIDFCYDHFKIDLRGEPKPAEADAGDNDLVNGLILESLHTLKLPEVLLGDEYEKSARVEETDLVANIYLDFCHATSGVSGTIIITQYKDMYMQISNGVGNVSGMYTCYEQITVNGKDVLVFGNDEKFYIKYVDGNSEYEIALLNLEFETAVKIAESIK